MAIKSLKESLRKIKASIAEAERSTQEKSLKYQKMYTEMTDPTKVKKRKKDLYSTELKYRLTACEQLSVHRLYGHEVIKVWEDVKRLEINRLECVQRAFQYFLQKNIETYGKTKEFEGCLKMYTAINPYEEGSKTFRIQELITQPELQAIKSHHQAQGLTMTSQI